MPWEAWFRIPVSPIPYPFSCLQLFGEFQYSLDYCYSTDLWRYRNQNYLLLEASKRPLWCLRLQKVTSDSCLDASKIRLYPLSQSSGVAQWQMALLEQLVF